MCGSSCRRSRNRQQLEPLPAFTAKGSLSPSLSLEKDKIIQQYTKSLDKRSLAALDGGAETGSIAPPTYAAVMESHSPVDIKPVELIPANPLNAECATSGHRLKRHYGLVGLVGGLMFFPWGLFWTACDSSVSCDRCGAIFKQKHRKGVKCPGCRRYGCEGRCRGIVDKL